MDERVEKNPIPFHTAPHFLKPFVWFVPLQVNEMGQIEVGILLVRIVPLEPFEERHLDCQVDVTIGALFTSCPAPVEVHPLDNRVAFGPLDDFPSVPFRQHACKPEARKISDFTARM